MFSNYHYFIVQGKNPKQAIEKLQKEPSFFLWGSGSYDLRIVGCLDEKDKYYYLDEDYSERFEEWSVKYLNDDFHSRIMYPGAIDCQTAKVAINDIFDHNCDMDYLLKLYTERTFKGKPEEFIFGVDAVFDYFSLMYEGILAYQSIEKGEKFNLFKHEYREWKIAQLGVTHMYPKKKNEKLWCVIVDVRM